MWNFTIGEIVVIGYLFCKIALLGKLSVLIWTILVLSFNIKCNLELFDCVSFRGYVKWH